MVGLIAFYGLTNQIEELIVWSGVYAIIRQNTQQNKKSDLCHTHQWSAIQQECAKKPRWCKNWLAALQKQSTNHI